MGVHQWVDRLRNVSLVFANKRSAQQGRDLKLLVDEAREEWLTARRYFETVSDPELVDHAIFHLEAAHRKYLYLFRQLRRRETEQSGEEDAVWM